MEQEADMPLEDLLKMYGYKNPGEGEEQEGEEDEEAADKEGTEGKGDSAEKKSEEQKVRKYYVFILNRFKLMSFSLLRLHLRRPERNGQPKMETRMTMVKRKQVSVVIKFLFLRNVHLSHFLLQ